MALVDIVMSLKEKRQPSAWLSLNCLSSKDHTTGRPLVSMARTATKSAEPMTDQTIGKDLPPTLIAKTSGKPNRPAIHVPTTAPTNPTSMDVMQPPTE